MHFQKLTEQSKALIVYKICSAFKAVRTAFLFWKQNRGTPLFSQ